MAPRLSFSSPLHSFFIFFFIFFFLLSITQHGGRSGGVVSGFSLTLLHTSDLAAQTVAVDNIDNPCTLLYNTTAAAYVYADTAAPPCIGGVPRLKTAIDAARAEGAAAGRPVLLLDAGNMFQSDYDTGSLVFKTYGEEAVYYFMGAMDYDAIHFNYREYILGFEPLAYFVANMTAQGAVVVEANLNWATQREFRDLTIPAFTTFNYSGGELVGFTAGINGDLSTLLSFPQNTSASNEVAGIRRAVGIMQNMGVNKIIVAVSSNFVLASGTNPSPALAPLLSFFISACLLFRVVTREGMLLSFLGLCCPSKTSPGFRGRNSASTNTKFRCNERD
jgi:5'-nucleotidase